MNLEQELKQLEEIAKKLESDELPLDEAIEGTRLTEFSRRKGSQLLPAPIGCHAVPISSVFGDVLWQGLADRVHRSYCFIGNFGHCFQICQVA